MAKKKKAPDFINLAQDKLKEHFNAMVSEKALQILDKKGFEFQSMDEVHKFFKDRIKMFTDEKLQQVTLAVEDQPFMKYQMPDFKQKGMDISIGFKFMEL